MAFDVDLVSHIRSINACLQQLGGSAELNPETLGLTVRARGKYIELQPQFIMPKETSIAFTPKLLPEVQSFCGWRSYFNRGWPISIDKMKFKEFCRENSLLTPSHFLTAAAVDRNVIIKNAQSCG